MRFSETNLNVLDGFYGMPKNVVKKLTGKQDF